MGYILNIMIVGHSFNYPQEEATVARNLAISLTKLGHKILYLGMEWAGTYETPDIVFVSSCADKDISRAVECAVGRYNPDWLISALEWGNVPKCVIVGNTGIKTAYYAVMGERIPFFIKDVLSEQDSLILATTRWTQSQIPSSQYVGIGRTYNLAYSPEVSNRPILGFFGTNNFTMGLASLTKAVNDADRDVELRCITDVDNLSNQGLVKMHESDRVLFPGHFKVGPPYRTLEGWQYNIIEERMSRFWYNAYPNRVPSLPISVIDCMAAGIPNILLDTPQMEEFKGYKIPAETEYWGKNGLERFASAEVWKEAIEELPDVPVEATKRYEIPTWNDVSMEVLKCLEDYAS